MGCIVDVDENVFRRLGNDQPAKKFRAAEDELSRLVSSGHGSEDGARIVMAMRFTIDNKGSLMKGVERFSHLAHLGDKRMPVLHCFQRVTVYRVVEGTIGRASFSGPIYFVGLAQLKKDFF